MERREEITHKKDITYVISLAEICEKFNITEPTRHAWLNQRTLIESEQLVIHCKGEVSP